MAETLENKGKSVW